MARVSIVVLLSAVLFVLLSTVCHGIIVTEVANGFTWAENLRCDAATESLFVSEYKRGELYRITHSQGSYNQSIHLHTGYDIFAGLAIHEATGTLYAIAQRSSDKACVILNVDTTEPETASVVATLPKLGNGLAIDQASGMLYATAEGDFIPFEGEVYKVDPSTGSVVTILPRSFADDGAYIDQERGLLYVSKVVISDLLVFNVSTGGLVHSFSAPHGVAMLDDYTLTQDGSTLVGADFWNGNVVAFPAAGGGSLDIMLRHLSNPTSVRWGCTTGDDSPFPTTSLYVTEGGGLDPATTRNRLVLELSRVTP